MRSGHEGLRLEDDDGDSGGKASSSLDEYWDGDAGRLRRYTGATAEHTQEGVKVRPGFVSHSNAQH